MPNPVTRRSESCARYRNFKADKEHDTETRTERLPVCRAQTDEGKPVIQLQLFHDTLSHLRSLTVGFEVLGGVTPEKALKD